jgi:hypothetical protein
MKFYCKLRAICLHSHNSGNQILSDFRNILLNDSDPDLDLDSDSDLINVSKTVELLAKEYCTTKFAPKVSGYGAGSVQEVRNCLIAFISSSN